MDKELEEKEVEKMSALPKTSTQSKVTVFCYRVPKDTQIKIIYIYFITEVK